MTMAGYETDSLCSVEEGKEREKEGEGVCAFE